MIHVRMNTNNSYKLIVILALLALSGCGQKPIKADLTTPEGAILSLEEAYRQHDVEKAVACKNFKVEAAYMSRDKPAEFKSEELISKLAEILELAYRAEMKKGFPDFNAVTSSKFPKKRDLGDGKMAVTEVCKYTDGGTSTQEIMIAKTETGWKVMIPVRK